MCFYLFYSDLELWGRGGGGWREVDLITPLAFLPSVISSFFTQNKGGDPGAPGAPLDSPLLLYGRAGDLACMWESWHRC